MGAALTRPTPHAGATLDPNDPLLVQVDAIGRPGARHAIDNEAWPVGHDVLAAAVAYLDGVLAARPRPVSLAACQPYKHAYLQPGAPR